MLTLIKKISNIDQIIDQVSNLHIPGKSLVLNQTNGNLLSGNYETLLEFKNTPLGNLLDSLGDIGEARLLKLEAAESYTAHTDPDDRIHLVITTNPHCYLIDLENKKMYHLPVNGELWNMDTGVEHVAVNFGARPRIHLNIRYKMPQYQTPGYYLKVEGGDYDWKQELYSNLMSFINYNIKSGSITGIEKVNERELKLTCEKHILDQIVSDIESKGFTVTVQYEQ